MGSSQSKQNENNSMDRTGSLRRSSKFRNSNKSKADQIDSISQMVLNLKNEIDIFEGTRGSDRYKEFHKILTTLSKNVQQIKSQSKKQGQHDQCDQTLGEIQNCFQRLETRVTFNEQNDRSLDMASVESHSFINHAFQQKPPPPALLNEKWAEKLPKPNKQPKQPKFDSIKNFERLEHETQILEQEIKRSIDLEDYKQFTILQKKIEILYGDLEMINVEEHSPLSEKKAAFGKKLIKLNNQVKKAKKAMENKVVEYSSKQDGPAFSKPKSNVDYSREKDDWLENFSRTEGKLEELEIQALTFEGFKSDRKYKELEQILESYWTKIYTVDAFGNKDKERRENIIERIKNIMQELRKRAEENEQQALAIKKLNRIDQDVQVLKKKSEEFKGITKDENYLELDQNLRSAWANLNQVEEPNEHVRRSKIKVVNDIQNALKRFSEDSRNRESENYENAIGLPKEEDIIQSQLLNQVKEFQNHWNQLNYNLDVLKITNSDTSKSIVDILEKVVEGISKKKNALVIIEKRKSTGSLVIAKVIDNTDLLAKVSAVNSRSLQDLTPTFANDQHQTMSSYQIYSVTPDLLQKQPTAVSPISKVMETEIKVQPTVKTIGEIQRVGTEAKLLLQNIRQSNCVKYDSEYNRFHGKLEQCRKILESIYYNKKSDTIESNRRRVHKTIQEAYRALDEKGTKLSDEQDKSSKAQEIMDIDAGIQYFRQQIKVFIGVTKDKHYEKIKQGFSDCLMKLQLLDDMHMNKQDSIRHIQQYHQELETKLAENQAKVRITEQQALIKRQIHQDIQIAIEQVQKLKGQVERFSGVYEGLPYKQIEKQLNECSKMLEKIDTKGYPRYENAKIQTMEKIRKYLIILEGKSAKPIVQKEDVQEQQIPDQKPHKEEASSRKQNSDQILLNQARKSQLMDPDSPHYKINTLRDKLVEIKNRTETFLGKYKDDQYRDIEMDLINCLEELKFIQDLGHKSVIISKEQYEDYIQKLMHYFEEKSKINESSLNTVKEELKDTEIQTYSLQAKQSSQKYKIMDPMEELTTIEEKINKLKSKIDKFEGIPDDDVYKDIHQTVESQTAKLNQVEAGNVAHVRERKKKLVQELVNCSKLLEEKANGHLEMLKSPEIQKEFDKVEAILQEVNETAKEVYAFEGTKNDKDFCYLDEVLIRLMIQLDNIETYNNNELKEARKTAIQLIQKTIRILNDRTKPKEDVGLAATVI